MELHPSLATRSGHGLANLLSMSGAVPLDLDYALNRWCGISARFCLYVAAARLEQEPALAIGPSRIDHVARRHSWQDALGPWQQKRGCHGRRAARGDGPGPGTGNGTHEARKQLTVRFGRRSEMRSAAGLYCMRASNNGLTWFDLGLAAGPGPLVSTATVVYHLANEGTWSDGQRRVSAGARNRGWLNTLHCGMNA